MVTINPKNEKIQVLHNHILGSVGPRPIAFVSTVDKNGKPNLSPFSFFNAFSANPPILIFSSARRVRDNTIKHTLENVHETSEVVVNTVTYDMVYQASLTSTEYPKGINEFVKAGFTAIPSEMVKPFRVKESPVQMECKVNKIIELGTEKGAGNLIICEILLMHIDEKVFGENGIIDPHKIGLVARMGGNWYCHAHGNALFEVEKPLTTLGIGVDKIPQNIRNSDILTGNNLGQLGNVESLPGEKEISEYRKEKVVDNLFEKFPDNKVSLNKHLHLLAKDLLSKGKVLEAWKALLLNQ